MPGGLPMRKNPCVHDIEHFLRIAPEAQGAVQFEVPIKVIPARGRAPLQLRLLYDSGRAQAPCGVGWLVSEQYIEEEPGKLTFVEDGAPRRMVELQSESGVFRLTREDA